MTKVFGQRDRDDLVAAVNGGEAVRAAARRVGVSAATAYLWIRRAREAAEGADAPRFLELVAKADIGLIVRVGPAEIEVRAGFDVELLRAVVVALRSTP